MTKIHVYKPFNDRDSGCYSCQNCYEKADNHCHVNQAFIDRVSEMVGVGPSAWDMVDPVELILAVVKAGE